jgi:hypothetical protein
VCVEDFNKILTHLEKWGGNTRNRRQMWDFQQALEECELTDLGFLGLKFTWSNCREDIRFIKERLDRGLANQEWRDLFPEVVVVVELALGSDHLLVLVSLDGNAGKKIIGLCFGIKLAGLLKKTMAMWSNVHGKRYKGIQVHGKVWRQSLVGVKKIWSNGSFLKRTP